MSIPTEPFGIVALLILLVPGAVYTYVRTRIRGQWGGDKEIGSRLLQTVVASVLLDAVYLWFFYDSVFRYLVEAERLPTSETAPLLGFTILVFGVAIPAAAAMLFHYRPRWKWLNRIRSRLRWLEVFRSGIPFRNTPTAWDFAAPHLSGSFVRIRTKEGGWIGGWFAGGSFVSTYPEERDIFISLQYRMNDDGSFDGEMERSRGVWVPLGEGYVVEWFADEQ